MARVLVIGAGFTGLLSALALADAGHAVTLLERHTPGAGSSSRTAAGIRQQFSTPGTIAGMRYAVRAYLDLGRRVSQACITQQGYLFLHTQASRAQAQSLVALQHRCGLSEVCWLDRESLQERFPEVTGETVVGGSWCPTDGFLHPAVILHEVALLLVTKGVDLHAHTEVVGARVRNGRLVAVQSNRGVFEADVFIDATNAWSGGLAARLGAEVLPITPTTRYLWFLRRSERHVAPRMPQWPLIVSPSGVYARPENPASLMMGWSKGLALDPLAPDERLQDDVPPEFAGGSAPSEVALEAWAGFAEAVPVVASFDGFSATTTGFYAMTPDHNPWMGYDRRVPNLIRLVGFSGHGAMFAPVTAQVALALVENGRDVQAVHVDEGEVDLEAFKIGRAFQTQEAMVI